MDGTVPAAVSCTWSIAAWLSALPLGDAIASALSAQDLSELADLRCIGSDPDGRTRLRQTLQLGDVASALASTLWPAFEALALAAAEPAPKLNARCVEANHARALTDEVWLPGGLEQLVGSPAVDVLDAMRQEHCESADSTEPFTEPTYGVTTTPRVEWYFVVDPTAALDALGLAAYPAEAPGTIHGPARPRQPTPLTSFDATRAMLNEQLACLYLRRAWNPAHCLWCLLLACCHAAAEGPASEPRL